ncbi:G2/mitotic-specific cyclin S13-7 [Lathyrus oleraceus]|uniref:G2/mitotic-specific cyclin S13-7 n=1 Tax=Pisum sativum TaxID=3888 RepID=UPI0021D0656C|nr:G2/mitotic-specific cyclin S13-7-like [Pisum sativum]
MTADPHANEPKRITRNQLAAIAQAAEKNKMEQAPKPAEHEVIVISSDEEAEVKDKRPLKGRKLRDRSKINVRTFSSVLSARSKATGRSVPNDLVMSIDATDKDNELAATEYIDDIYKFYKLSEGDCPVHDYMVSQPYINAKMREILIDWLIEVHRKFKLMPETFYLTLNIVDRFLSMKVVPRKELQLVGISSMLIASKYEEIWAPEVTDFVCISDNAYVREQVLVMEKTILGNLEWYLTVPTPYVFLVRYIKASTPSDKQMGNMVNFLDELSMMHYVTVSSYSPSMIGASAVYAARCTTRSRNIEAGGVRAVCNSSCKPI